MGLRSEYEEGRAETSANLFCRASSPLHWLMTIAAGLGEIKLRWRMEGKDKAKGALSWREGISNRGNSELFAAFRPSAKLGADLRAGFLWRRILKSNLKSLGRQPASR